MPFSLAKTHEKKPAKPIECNHKNNKMTVSLRTSQINPINSQAGKRASLSASGSLTVETALVLPIFLFAMLAVAFIAEGFRLFGAGQAKLYGHARELSQYAYISKDVPITDKMICLAETKQVKIPFLYFRNTPFFISMTACTYPWIGYDNARTDGMPLEEELVYITPSGKVYHRSLSCTHIRLNILSIPQAAVDAARNEYGGKYKRCEICGKRSGSGAAYIAASGDKYHMSLACSGLKRNIITIPISKAGGRPACARCKGG